MGLFDRRERGAAPGRPVPRYGVLIVDDEILNLTSLTALLEDDYLIHIASNAQDALALLADPVRAAGIHVILSDQRMPGMSGVELLARTRAHRPDAKRLLITGYTDVEAIVDAINEAAIYKYLRKPIDGQELKLVLARACEAWQLERDNEGLLAELRQAFTRLQLLDADKMAFLRYLAHEMNTPLNWLAATDIIDRAALSKEAREMLGYVDQGQERLRGLVEAVLRYFQVAGLEVAPGSGQADLSLLLARQAAALREQHGERLAVRLEQPVTLTLETDPELLAELVGHLLENAATHSLRAPAGPAEVVVTVREEERGLRMVVADSGPGLPARALPGLFRPFAFTGSAHGHDGFGLSLATAHALATALGGELRLLEAGEGRGARLELRLPLTLPRQGA
ncbi:MAG TPA: hybrid sensor histidine kinase/response regulator [Moraxellaceae bacterium]|nr:hybrid sensor histidine kinase/response regulator [Moraxellaceae bacterium]